jgi:hypothetical protein
VLLGVNFSRQTIWFFGEELPPLELELELELLLEEELEDDELSDAKTAHSLSDSQPVLRH